MVTLQSAACLYATAFSISCFVFFALDGKLERRDCIKFCAKLAKSATETLEPLRDAFGESL
jgi:hypothetical protein